MFVVPNSLHDKRRKHWPISKLGDLVRTADMKRVFSGGDTTNWSYEIYTKTEVIQDTIPSYSIKYSPQWYQDNLIGPSELGLNETKQVMEELNLIQ